MHITVVRRATLLSACVAAASLLAFSAVAKPPATEDLVRARSMMFGAEHVDQQTGQVDQGKVMLLRGPRQARVEASSLRARFGRRPGRSVVLQQRCSLSG